MQYEVQTRSQKVYGQDVNANTITQICNADERGHRFNYLRDIYKYYRVSFPGEFEGERERPPRPPRVQTPRPSLGLQPRHHREGWSEGGGESPTGPAQAHVE